MLLLNTRGPATLTHLLNGLQPHCQVFKVHLHESQVLLALWWSCSAFLPWQARLTGVVQPTVSLPSACYDVQPTLFVAYQGIQCDSNVHPSLITKVL